MEWSRWFPIITWLPMVKNTWKDDLIAGITGTIIVIPQAVAFAMIAGMPPIYGFYTAMLTPVISAIFGSSYQLVAGPTTTSSIVLYSIVSQFAHGDSPSDVQVFVELAILLSFMAGVVKLFLGIVKAGKLVNFVSNSVVIGFSAGAGTLIAFKQLKHVFDIKVPQGSSFYEIVGYIGSHISETNWYAFAIAIATLILALLIRKFGKKISRLYMLFAMVFGSFLAIWLGGDAQGIKTVGEISSSLPPFHLPNFNWPDMEKLVSGAIILGILGLVEAVAISRSIALHTHQKLDSNQEFVSQGITSVVSSFFSCYTSSGSFTRSSINYQAGAKTPMSAIIAAFGLMLVVLTAAKYAAFLPKAAMGGIILLVGYNLIDFKHIKQIIKSSWKESIVFGITFLGTLFLSLQMALLLGIAASIIFYLAQTSNPNIAEIGVADNRFINIIRGESVQCPQLKVLRIDDSIYFGSLPVIVEYFSNLDPDTKNVLLICHGVSFIDLAGAEWLSHEAQKWREKGGGIYFSGLKLVSQEVLIKGGFIEKIGADHMFASDDLAVKTIYEKLDMNICAICTHKAFTVCK